MGVALGTREEHAGGLWGAPVFFPDLGNGRMGIYLIIIL